MTLKQVELFGIILLFVHLHLPNLYAQPHHVTVHSDEYGYKLRINGDDFFVNGMNWDYIPIGENYSYDLWDQPDDFIREALEQEMTMLHDLGVNTIRVYTGIQPKWITHIYQNYQIHTVLNHSFGRYGVTIDGKYIANTDYANPAVKDVLLREITELTREYKDVPGLLMWLLGNENNYGLFWGGAETEDIPEGETVESVRARHMYKLFNEGIKEIKIIDMNHPVAICNGDLQFLDIIAEEVTAMDVFGINSYRGISFTDLFQRNAESLDVPILFTEFGADAYNAIEGREDQAMQVKYLLGNWEEIYLHAYGNGDYGNVIGGMTFQFSDGWWKHKQVTNLDIHDTTATWANGGYSEDYVEGDNNMNEEWFGICAKGSADEKGLYPLYPRAAYYALQDAHKINPLCEDVQRTEIEQHFDLLSVERYVEKAAVK